MPEVRIGDITIGFEVHGDDGGWVLLVQGHAYARWGWNWQVPALAKDFRVITFDHRGIGSSSVPPPPYTVEQMTGDAIGVLDAVGAARAHVVGASLGGCIALEMGLSYPDRVGRLVLACSSLGGASPKSYPLMEAAVRLIREGANDPPEVRVRRGTENAFSPAFVREHPKVIDEILRLRAETAQPTEAWQAQSTAYPAYDATDRAPTLASDALVVTGTEDNVVDARNSRVLADTLPNATLVEVPGGHLFFIEQHERFNALVRDFLRTGAVAVAG